MKKWIITVLAMGLMLGNSATEPQSSQSEAILIIDLSKRLPENPYQEAYEKMLYPTVRVKSLSGTGSGVVIDNYILTAAHVVGNNSTVTIEVFYPVTDGLSILCASVAVTDTAKDLALLSPFERLPYQARLAPRSYTPYIFHPVWVVGCSLGLTPRPSYGYLSVLCDSVAGNWEISAPILPGNSGGPVFDARTYEVIGIAVWIHTYKSQLITTMGGIVPITEIYEFLQSAGVISERHGATEGARQGADTPPADKDINNERSRWNKRD